MRSNDDAHLGQLNTNVTVCREHPGGRGKPAVKFQECALVLG
jgi:hypothetical protein